MLSRLLLDPDASTEGVTTTATAAEPAPVVTPPVIPAAKPAKIEMDPADVAAHFQELEALRRFKAEADTRSKADRDKAEQERLAALAKAGEAEKALEEQRTSWEAKVNEANTRYQSLENTLLATEKGRVVADALAGVTFTNDFAKSMVVKHLNDSIDVARDASGKIVVRDRTTGQFAGEAIKAMLAGPEFSPFIKPSTTTGGTSTTGTTVRTEPAATEFKTAGERALAAVMARVPTEDDGFGFRPVSRN